MKTIYPLLLLSATAALFVSCVTDDYGSGYGYGNSGYYYDRPPPPPRYDNRYYRDDYRDDRVRSFNSMV